ncbi:2-oxoglutarate (2OG) and Fe(II)-dependent oxygenase superfamily protein [Rhynchospora pubera]|uniref:2-oxoglutarate (2OG) and Fe(II)-dependent oxygenase superfamily protein n=1 Tax=Rhynchospora pubera TaxID=906938 RepID=A0AAV8DXB1_9POAL|nr:2-oxoglutarate (2OG) and Fe(II)-dependent oxygenase superfamily protein [Rhynchospora pubera]
MCLMIIKKSIPESFRGTVSDSTNAKEILGEIEKRFVKNEKSEICTLMAKLTSMKYNAKGNIREYVMEMSHLASKLGALKLDISKEIQVCLVLNSLPSQFNQFKVRIRNRKVENKEKVANPQNKPDNKKVKKVKDPNGCHFCGKAGTQECKLHHLSCLAQTESPPLLPPLISLPHSAFVMAEQLLSIAPCHDTLPKNYIRPVSQRPRLSEVVTDTNIPIIDLSSPNKSLIISQIANACEKYGFFQVVNHGITEEMLRKVMGIGKEFFKLPPEEKAKLYSDDPAKKMRLSTSFNVRKETVHNWRDYLRLHCYPLEEFVPDWPSKPELFKEIMSTYCTQVRQLGFRLFGYISEGLGLETDYIENVLGEQEQHLAVNYYPQCPEPELTYGLPAHTDPNALTILLQDQQVSGLQVLKEGKWIAVDPVPWAFTINIVSHKCISNGSSLSNFEWLLCFHQNHRNHELPCKFVLVLFLLVLSVVRNLTINQRKIKLHGSSYFLWLW